VGKNKNGKKEEESKDEFKEEIIIRKDESFGGYLR